MYGCKSWTTKKAEHQRIKAFELWCWRVLRVPWTARRSNQSIIKEISPECSLEGWCWSWSSDTLAMKWRTDSLEKTLILEKTEGRRRRGRQDEIFVWHHRLDRYEFEQSTKRVCDGQGNLACMESPRVGHNWASELNWTELSLYLLILFTHFTPPTTAFLSGSC